MSRVEATAVKNGFNRGDLVTLKSGGPKLTVGHRFIAYPDQPPGPAYLCLWFDADNNDRRQVFSEEVLKLYEKDD